ncbi:hypothetical protein LPTSP4_02770 [Leptospira ryugenii]|uniref:Uncharacterized protein n=1 Tax=Leptospira ryugenii TaxID=1917863 RepID=A0A2P2DVZ4_9LEPT|nr:hypothetical protein [Leptospira ryugenii]GBF48777.1 hypothetical protein LPTSP4_02770 [Leptospira ryugenii]
MDFGEWKSLHICILKEDGFAEDELKELYLAWGKELELYKIRLHVSRQTTVERPGFYGWDILAYLRSLSLPSDCDRLVYLKGRKWSDIGFEFFSLGMLWGIGLKLEVQGAVETETRTRGYIKGKYISTLQLLFTSPKSTLIHEGYHLLGCDHQLWMEACYVRIKTLKQAKEENSKSETFFPGLDMRNQPILKRELVDQTFLQP